MISRKAWLRLSATLAFAPFAPASIANAQEAATPPAAAADEESASGLTEIVVTAQQRGENLQKAAVALSVVTGEDLQKAGIVGIETLQKNVPALQVGNGSTGNFIFIRGVGSFSISPTSDPAVAFNYDGVYVGRSGSTTGALFDLARVEVLKGPQGTLYGRNATAGAINVLPTQPQLGEFSGYATAGYGNDDAYNVEGALNAAAGDNAGLRFSGIYAQHDGYLRDGTSSDKTLGLRGQLKVELDPRLTVRIAADYAHQGAAARRRATSAGSLSTPLPGRLPSPHRTCRSRKASTPQPPRRFGGPVPQGRLRDASTIRSAFASTSMPTSTVLPPTSITRPRSARSA